MGLNDYELHDLLAVQWNELLAARFPNASHQMCRQEMRWDGEQYVSYSPVRCIGWHCHKCGEPTNMMGHHHTTKDCLARN